LKVHVAADPYHHRERRVVADRPRNGDTKPCCTCGGRSEFNERYRFDGMVVPSWLCDGPKCLREIVRRPTISAVEVSWQTLRSARELDAKARRTTMKARAKVERSLERLVEGGAGLKRKLL